MMLRNQIADAEKLLIDVDHKVGKFIGERVSDEAADRIHPFSKLADQPQLRALSAGVLLAGTISGSDRLVRAGARMMIAHEAATFAKDRIKTEIDRLRPRAATKRADVKVKKGNHKSKELSSFPSGHTAGGVAVARAFSREFPEYGAASVAVATLIASLQIPRSAHYPSDIAAGLALGLAVEKGVDLAWRAADMDRRSSSEADEGNAER